MTVQLKDVPGGPALIARLTQAMKGLSLLYAGTPDEKAQASLKEYVDAIRPDLVASVGANNANKMLEAFTSAVMGEKHRIEAAGASRA